MKNPFIRFVSDLFRAGLIKLGYSTPKMAEESSGFVRSKKGDVTIYPIPKSETVFDGYQLKINEKSVPIYSCRVSAVPYNQWYPGYQRPLEQTELAGFAYWDMNHSVHIEVTSQDVVTTVVVRPLSLGIKPNVDGHKIRFELNAMAPVTIEVNGYHHALHLFPNPEEKDKLEGKPGICTYQCSYCAPVKYPAPMTGPSNVIHFGPGVHDVGTLQLKSGDSVYIAGGAVVYGCFAAFDATNIRLYGRGILDSSRINRNEEVGIGGFGCLYFRNCNKIRIEGIVLRDPPFWGVTVRDCREVNLSNLKLIGFWRYNADGIDVWNCSDVLVENCFVRSFDDSLVVRGGSGVNDTKNIRFNTCVLWCDWGIALEIYTMNTPISPTAIKNITFEKIDIIRTTGKAINIIHGTQAIYNVTYRNVNLEIDERPLRQQHQSNRSFTQAEKMIDERPLEQQHQRAKDEKYTTDPNDMYCPSLITIGINEDESGNPVTPKIIDGLLFENINIVGNTSAASSIMAPATERGTVSNVMIKNLRHNGELVKDINKAHFSISPHVQGVRIESRS